MMAGALWRLTAVLGLGGLAVLVAGTYFLSEPASGPSSLRLPGPLAGAGVQALRPEAPARAAPGLSSPNPSSPNIAASIAPAASAAPRADAAAPAVPAEPPRFDVVRIGARGTAVVAGRAEPGTEVILLEDGREIGRARADARGEWVILPASPLPPGSRQLTLVARRAGGEEIAGPDTVVVVVAEPSAAQATAADAPAAARQQMAAAETAGTPPMVAGPDGIPQVPAPMTRPAGSPLVVLVPGAGADGAPAPLPRVLQGGAGAGTVEAPQPPAATGTGRRLSLDVVDYDEAGTIRFAGSAAPGSSVRLYVDDQHLGDATADAQGRWQFAPQRPVTAGRHRLRVDQLATSGSVAARIELPFLREEMAEASLRGAAGGGGGSVVVQPGHSLWRIARQSYGRGMQFTLIYEANRAQIRNPDLIYPGQVFALPVSAGSETSSTPPDSSRSR
jgi:hypothetical protein